MQRTLINHHIIRNLHIVVLYVPHPIGLNHGKKSLIRFIVLPLTLQRNAFQGTDDGRIRLFRIPLLVLFDFGERSQGTTPFELVWRFNKSVMVVDVRGMTNGLNSP